MATKETQDRAATSQLELLEPTTAPLYIDNAGAPHWAADARVADILKRLAEMCPHAAVPTAAQIALLLTVHRGLEVYLKDKMGRGKTLALALAALSLVYPRSNKQVLILVPTLHLQHQVASYLELLSPARNLYSIIYSSASPESGTRSNWTAPILLTTPRSLETHRRRPSPSHIFLDEPDTQIGPLPTSFVPEKWLHLQPIYAHPPPLARLLDDLLGIRMLSPGVYDFDGRRDDVQTVWVSATMNTVFRRWTRNRGWVKMGDGASVNLDYTGTASASARRAVEGMQRIYEATRPAVVPASDVEANGTALPLDKVQTSAPQHFAIVVDPETGDLSNLDPDLEILPPPKGQPPPDRTPLAPSLVEAMALLHVTSPPPPGKVALALPPEGTSYLTLAADLEALDVQASVLHADDLTSAYVMPAAAMRRQTSGAANDGQHRVPPVLIAPRSAITGLHLERLHTIYLLGGVDMAGMTPQQKRRGGEKDRARFYATAEGRLGRFGMAASAAGPVAPVDHLTPSADGGRDPAAPDTPQRVVSVVLGGSPDERGIYRLFHGALAGPPEGRYAREDARPRRQLSTWPFEDMVPDVDDDENPLDPSESGQTAGVDNSI